MTEDTPRPAAPTIAGLGEDRLVADIVSAYRDPPGFVVVGPGDDAAVLDLRGPVVASTDTLVEGRDFLFAWSDGHDLGVKTAAQNLADIAAMGARPMALLVSLAAPATLPVAVSRDLAEGLDDECRRAGASVVGGDVSDADTVVLTATALGVLDGPAVLRSGARAGDVVALAGRTGPSAAGLAVLTALAGAPVTDLPTDGPVAAVVRAHRAPRPGYAAGPQAAAAGATALIDTSDGLLRDAARIAGASRVVLDLDPQALAARAGEDQGDLAEVAEYLRARGCAGDLTAAQLVLQWQLTGGEDHALLACFPPGAVLPDAYRVIGTVRPVEDSATGAPGVLVAGRPWSGTPGWTHWQ